MERLLTDAAENIGVTPWNVYPRPQLKRNEWVCLNGIWHLTIGKEKNTPSYDGDVLVPFCPESILSGVQKSHEKGDYLVYSRDFALPDKWEGNRIILNFGAVDQECTVYVNGTAVGSHVGGYLPFSFDITDCVKKDNKITVKVRDDLNHTYPWGKQKNKRGGMWYTPVSGIWQSVWIEPVPDEYIEKIKIETEENKVKIKVKGIKNGKVTIEGNLYSFVDGKLETEISDPHMWSPENPYLYSLSIEAGEDKVESYFALRDLDVKKINGIPRLCLNGKPYFFNGLLDQGYWSDGIYTPAAPEMYEKDIIEMKKLGFNTLRKHIKIEPEQFYYDCDRLGMVVFQDMVNCGDYSFVRDTVIPTVGLIVKPDNISNRDKDTRRFFLHHMKETVKHLRNHPSICYWTIFNEGWGQFLADQAYKELKSIDDTRFIDTTSGWFHRSKTDVDSIHKYFGKLKRRPNTGKPYVLSEFGGYSYKVNGHSFNKENSYGYGKYSGREEFVKAFRNLYLDQLLPLISKGLCAAIYTQVSDVEDETNGMLTYDRKICKLEKSETADIMRKCQEQMQDAQTL